VAARVEVVSHPCMIPERYLQLAWEYAVFVRMCPIITLLLTMQVNDLVGIPICGWEFPLAR